MRFELGEAHATQTTPHLCITFYISDKTKNSSLKIFTFLSWTYYGSKIVVT